MNSGLKTVCVTGASQGLGRFIAERFVQAGWQVALIARDRFKLEEVAQDLSRKFFKKPSEMLIITSDLSLADSAEYCTGILKKSWDHLDALVNNAGIQGPVGPLWKTDVSEWECAFETLLFAPLRMCRHIIPWMAETDGGSIVNLSGGGASGPRENFTAYAGAKTALVRVTETLAIECAAFGIAVNALAPGAMPTGLLSEVLSAGPEAAGTREYESARKLCEQKDVEPIFYKAAEAAFALCTQREKKITGKLISAVWDSWENLVEHALELQQSDIYTLRRIMPEDRGQSWGSGR